MLICILAAFSLTAQDLTPRFKHLQIEDGLSQTSVRSAIQDSRGFLWFATQEGLNRYDGYTMRVFTADPSEAHSLSSSELYALFEDRFGTIWVGTIDGLNGFDRRTESFVSYQHDPNDSTSLSHQHVTAVFEDHEGLLWVGTAGGGLNVMDRAEGRFVRYQHATDDSSSLSSNGVNVIYEDRSGGLWVGTDGGLNLFDRESRRFVCFTHDPRDPTSLLSDAVTAIHQDGSGTLWIGTGSGLSSFDRSRGRFTRYEHDPNDRRSIGRGIVTSILEDRFGILWVGVDDAGLYVMDRLNGTFTGYRHDPYRLESLAGDRVISLMEDRAGVLWVGTYSRGVDRYDRYTAKFSPSHSRPDLAGDVSDYVRTFLVDRSGALWIGTDGDGVTRLNRRTGALTHFKYDPSNPVGLSNDRVFSLFEDRSGTVWVGTFSGELLEYSEATGTFRRHDLGLPAWTNLRPNTIRVIHEDRSGALWIGTDGAGVRVYDRGSGRTAHIRRDDDDVESLRQSRITAIHEDRLGNMWIGMYSGGLDKLDRETGSIIKYRTDPEDQYSLGTNDMMAILEDEAGIIWLGTYGAGLNRLDPETGRVTQYREGTGLPNNGLYGVLQDDSGFLWISHNKGISRFDPSMETFKNFDSGDGLQSNEFNGGAYYKSSDGELFFGGINGYNSFYPEEIRDNSEVPPVVITDIQLYNQSVPIGEMEDGRTILSQSPTETKDLVLDHHDRVVSFEYAALLLGASDRIRYAYMLEGLEDDWSYVGARRFATYTHVPPGRYTFRVKASNGDGVWNEEGVSLAIRIIPPFWRTAWFQAATVLMLVSAVWMTILHRTRTSRKRAKTLERRVTERTADLEREIAERKVVEKRLARAHREALRATESKSEFLANMSHEIRTPMNGVLGMTQLVLDSDLDPLQRDQIETIHSSGEALLTIINDILDFSKIEAGKLDIEPHPFDLLVASSEVADLLAPKASEKGVELVLRYSPNAPRYLIGDAGRIRQVLLNLAGNAIKFTAGGHVLIEVEGVDIDAGESVIKISIHDTGIGISEEEKARLFQPFSQADGSTTRRFGGTGLGLAISRQLVELMGGHISVESVLGEGSTFWLSIKLQRAPKREPLPIPQLPLAGEPVLIVDDVAVNRRVIGEQLRALGMAPVIATNGHEALVLLREAAKAGSPVPLAVLDHRMPDMDGEELASAILADPTIADTAMVLMTSAAAPGDGRRFEDAGFAGYLVKPVRPDTFRDVLATVSTAKKDGRLAYDSLVTRHTIAEARASGEHAEDANAERFSSRWRVLVAEDNVVNQKVAKRMLEKLGCVVDVAANGEEAVIMWSKLPYHAVFMDCQMPELDGYAATGLIREREGIDRHTVIIAMTANAMEGDRERCIEAGMDDYMSKPLNLDRCRELLKEWVSGETEPPRAVA